MLRVGLMHLIPTIYYTIDTWRTMTLETEVESETNSCTRRRGIISHGKVGG